jgi:hypothetical protein
MADIRPLPTLGPYGPKRDKTAAERQRRYRDKQKQVGVRGGSVTPTLTLPEPVTASSVTPVTVAHPAVTPVTPATGVDVAVTMAALSLAAVSAGFSITGMTAVFVGATVPVVAMGAALELGKLSAVAWLGRHGGSPVLRLALIVLVAVLMALNAVGAYGFLARSNISHAVAGDVAIAGRLADVDARLSVQAGVLSDLDRRLAQIDGAVEKATSKGRTGSAMALADQERKTRAELVAERTSEAKTLGELQVQKTSIDGERRMVEADLGPVRYLATLLGAGDQDVLRYFILVVALLLDPAAVILLLAAASAGRARQ